MKKRAEPLSSLKKLPSSQKALLAQSCEQTIQFHILFIVRLKLIWICIVVNLNHLLIEHSTNDKGSQVSDLLLLVHNLANSHCFSVEKFRRAEPVVEEINHCPDQVDVDD